MRPNFLKKGWNNWLKCLIASNLNTNVTVLLSKKRWKMKSSWYQKYTTWPLPTPWKVKTWFPSSKLAKVSLRLSVKVWSKSHRLSDKTWLSPRIHCKSWGWRMRRKILTQFLMKVQFHQRLNKAMRWSFRRESHYKGRNTHNWSWKTIKWCA